MKQNAPTLPISIALSPSPLFLPERTPSASSSALRLSRVAGQPLTALRSALSRFPIGREVPKAAAATIHLERHGRVLSLGEECSGPGLACRAIECLLRRRAGFNRRQCGPFPFQITPARRSRLLETA